MRDPSRQYRDYRVRKLSASDKGRGIAVSAIASPGTLIHEALDSQALNEWDAVVLRAVNTTTSAIKLTIQWGGTGASDSIEVTIPAESGFTEVIDRHVLQDGAEVRAFAAVADGVILHGFVQRYEYSRP